MEPFVVTRLKQRAKNLLPILRICRKQLEEVALGYHGNLEELLALNAKDLFLDVARHIVVPHNGLSAWPNEFRTWLLLGSSHALQFWALVRGVSAHCVRLSPMQKRQRDFRRSGFVCVLRAKHGAIAVLATCLPKEGEGYGIENGGFARSRIARNQVQSL